jgi:hypothetical protein
MFKMQPYRTDREFTFAHKIQGKEGGVRRIQSKIAAEDMLTPCTLMENKGCP